ncbi:glycosyltransferase family 8 protein [Pasteurella sp. PK-2025]|uniref:glycosyltransferase family 8 protein n=1 Tax=Pasteurella sp. PK-2025 TaxID=3413133 RepID=UPI003C712CAC
MNIVLCADVKFTTQVTTLIKSICYHNRHVHFYLLNKDYPTEWFEVLNRKLSHFGSEVFDAKVLSDIFANFSTLSHISEASYYRYLVGQLPLERVLYLDCDIIVAGCLRTLYHRDFEENTAFAVFDTFLNTVPHSYKEFPDMKPYFNSGVMLLNLEKWRADNIEAQLIELTQKAQKVYYGDQDILNIILKGKWQPAEKIYNYQVAARLAFMHHNMQEHIAPAEDFQGKSPKIIHYTTKYKPWLLPVCEIPLREQYWFYYQLDWRDIVDKWTEQQ